MVNIFNNKKIFITGGTGFIGKNLLKQIINKTIKPCLITILTRNKSKFIDKYPELQADYINYIESDIIDLVWDGKLYDYVIHAATSVVDQEPPIELFDNIVTGTKNTLNFALKAQASRFINFSSGAVYQNNITKEGLTENSLLVQDLENEKNCYAIAKISSEHLCYLYSQQYDMKIITLRCFCFGGDYLDNKHFALGEFIQKAKKNEDIIVNAGSGIYRSYILACELINIIGEIASKNTMYNYEVYNIGSDAAISLPDLAKLIVKTLNSTSQVITPNLDNQTVNYYVPNVDKCNLNFNLSLKNINHCILSTNSNSL